MLVDEDHDGQGHVEQEVEHQGEHALCEVDITDIDFIDMIWMVDMHLVGEIYQPQAAVCHIHGPQVQVGHGEEQGGQDPELCSGLVGSHYSLIQGVLMEI